MRLFRHTELLLARVLQPRTPSLRLLSLTRAVHLQAVEKLVLTSQMKKARLPLLGCLGRKGAPSSCRLVSPRVYDLISAGLPETP